MKIWKIYKKPSDINDRAYKSLYDKYPLYGITNDHKILKQFFQLRDENKFIVREDTIDSDDFSDLINTHRSAYISKHSLKTIKNHKVTNIDLVMTALEYNTVVEESAILIDAIVDQIHEVLPFDAIKDKYLKFLINTAFIFVYHSACVYNAHSSEYMTEEQEIRFKKVLSGMEIYMPDYSMPDFTHDDLSVFLYLYKDILK